MRRSSGSAGAAVVTVIVIAVALVLGRWTARRCQDYRSEISLWIDTVGKRPANARARNNLGVALVSAGRRQEAKGQFLRIIRDGLDYAGAHNNLGNLLSEEGDLDGAAGAYERAIAMVPAYATRTRIWACCAAVRGGSGRRSSTSTMPWRRTGPRGGALQPGSVLGDGRAHGQAMPHFEEAVRLQPDRADVLNALAWVLATHPDHDLRDPARSRSRNGPAG